MPIGLLIGTNRHAFKKKNREGGKRTDSPGQLWGLKHVTQLQLPRVKVGNNTCF